ncbi:hypothetical protein P5V15_014158 [Pogonomyrmex californicus]
MREKIILKEVMFVVRLSLFPVWGWPVSKDAKFKIFCVKMYQTLCIIISMCHEIPLIYGALNNLNKPVILVQQLLLASGCTHVILDFIFYRLNYHHLQDVTFKMTDYFDLKLKSTEEVVIKKYIDKCLIFYGFCMFMFYLITIVSLVAPSVLEQDFPTLAEYPFNVSNQPLKMIIYVHQCISGLITAGQLCTNNYMALLLWFTSARFEILTEELRSSTDIHQLFKCIKTHQELLKYAAKVAFTVRSFAFTTICCSTFCIIIVLLLLITRHPTVQIIQFSGLVLICLSEVFMFTWPAEYLMYKSNATAQAAFDAFQCNQSIKMWNCLQIIVMRSQKPVMIRISCLMPTLCFNYFTTYCSTIVSYFTTLRVVMNEDN